MSVKQHYDQHLGNFYSWMLGDFYSQQQAFENFLKEQNLHPSSTRVAVDLGAGNGIQSISLAKIGYQVIAIDFNEQLLTELASNTEDLPVEVIRADMRKFTSYIKELPELIICWGDTLTHLENKKEIDLLLQQAVTSLSKDGKLLLSFRDYSHELTGNSRFIPVRSDEQRILTCFLEYFPEHVRVTDLLYEKNGQHWQQKVSSYLKVRISPDEVIHQLKELGLQIILQETKNGMIKLIATK